MRSTVLGITVTALAMMAPACRKGEEVTTEQTVPAAIDAQVPHDHLAPGELLEGTEKAFGLALPRGVKIDSNLPPQIIASGDPKAADVANYIRARVSMGVVKVGAASTMFTRAQVPANPGRELNIRVEPRANTSGVLLTIRDVTPPQVDQTMTEDQRWKQVGIAPGGKIADPSHLH